MATARVKCARRLAGLLTEATQSGVALCYERARRGAPGHYRVVWTGGPLLTSTGSS